MYIYIYIMNWLNTVDITKKDNYSPNLTHGFWKRFQAWQVFDILTTLHRWVLPTRIQQTYVLSAGLISGIPLILNRFEYFHNSNCTKDYCDRLISQAYMPHRCTGAMDTCLTYIPTEPMTKYVPPNWLHIVSCGRCLHTFSHICPQR